MSLLGSVPQCGSLVLILGLVLVQAHVVATDTVYTWLKSVVWFSVTFRFLLELFIGPDFDYSSVANADFTFYQV